MSSKKVALVTGASAGIGEDIALRLLADGWSVWGAARRTDRMAGLAARGARIVALDVTDEASAAAAVKAVLDAEGRLDALINNAGYGSYGALEEVPLDEARRQFEVNVFGVLRLCQLVLPAMRAQGSGTIVNVTSMGGRIWMPIGGWYHATKHALEVLSDTLRLEVAPFGVRVVVVQPGAIRSEWSGVAADTLEKSSKGTRYEAMVGPMLKVLRGYTNASPPSVVSEAVSRALSTDRPRRRYATPFDAKALIFLHRWAPDWVWEQVVRRAIG